MSVYPESQFPSDNAYPFESYLVTFDGALGTKQEIGRINYGITFTGWSLLGPGASGATVAAFQEIIVFVGNDQNGFRITPGQTMRWPAASRVKLQVPHVGSVARLELHLTPDAHASPLLPEQVYPVDSTYAVNNLLNPGAGAICSLNIPRSGVWSIWAWAATNAGAAGVAAAAPANGIADVRWNRGGVLWTAPISLLHGNQMTMPRLAMLQGDSITINTVVAEAGGVTYWASVIAQQHRPGY